jgi:hypothetical protein
LNISQKYSTSFWAEFHSIDSSNIPCLLDLPIDIKPHKSDTIMDFGFGQGNNLLNLFNNGFRHLVGVERCNECIFKLRKAIPIPVHHYSELSRLAHNIDIQFFLMFGVLSTIVDFDERDYIIRCIDNLLSCSGIIVLYDYVYDADREHKYNTKVIDDKNHHFITPSWSQAEFVHYHPLQMNSLFSSFQHLQSVQVNIPSFRRSNSVGRLMVFRKAKYSKFTD